MNGSHISREDHFSPLLLAYSKEVDALDLFPAKYEEASQFAMRDPYAFCLACCFDRQMSAEVAWTIPWDIKNDLGHQFSAEDHRWMDVKPDVHVIRVLHRTGLIEKESEAEALEVTRRMNPEFPGMVDSALWRIGRKWCLAQEPLCAECVLFSECSQTGF